MNLGTNIIDLAGLALDVTVQAIRDRLPASLGAKTSALSFSTVPASDATFPVSGSVGVSGSVAITNAALDAALSTLAREVTVSALNAKTPALGLANVANSQPVVLAVASVASGATLATTGIQLKASPGTVFSCTWTNSTGGAVFIHFYDGNAQPSAGASPLWYSGSIASANVGSGGMGHLTRGVPCPTTGIYVVLSSTQGTYTAIASANFKYVFFYE